MNKKEKVFIFAFLALILFVYGAIVQAIITHHLKNDFSLFYHAAYSFWHHQAVYSTLPEEVKRGIFLQKVLHLQSSLKTYSGNLTPPTFILLSLPLGLLKEPNAIIVWAIFSLAIDCLNVYLLYRIFFKQYGNPIIYWILLGIYLASMPALANVSLGQLAPLILLAIIGLWQWSKNACDIKAGLLLGLILSIKYFFGLFAIFFLLQKRWRLLVTSVVSFIALNSLAYAVLGKETFLQYQQNVAHIYWYVNNWNASLFGFLSRFDARIVNLHFVTGLWVRIDYYCGCLALLFVEWYLCRKKFTSSYEFDFAFCYVLIAALLMSPLGWLYYLVLLIIPILFIMQNILATEKSTDYSALIIFLILMMLLNCPVLMRDTIHIGWRNLSVFIANSFYSLLFLLGMLFYYLSPQQKISPHHMTKAAIIPWLTIAYLASSFSLLFMLFTILRGGLNATVGV